MHDLLAAGLVDELRVFTFPVVLGKGKRLFDDSSQPRTYKLTESAVSPNGIIHATYVRAGEVKTAMVGGAQAPTPQELARREKLKREGRKREQWRRRSPSSIEIRIKSSHCE